VKGQSLDFKGEEGQFQGRRGDDCWSLTSLEAAASGGTYRYTSAPLERTQGHRQLAHRLPVSSLALISMRPFRVGFQPQWLSPDPYFQLLKNGGMRCVHGLCCCTSDNVDGSCSLPVPGFFSSSQAFEAEKPATTFGTVDDRLQLIRSGIHHPQLKPPVSTR